MAERSDPRVGTQFGRYRIRALLSPDQMGPDQMGQLYEAIDSARDDGDDRVALKLLPGAANDPAYRARFTNEMPIAAGVTEPHVIPIHEWGEIDGVCYIAMRLLAGDTLQSLVNTYGPLSPARAVSIVEQVAAALDAAHATRLIHRDVKPENIIVAADGCAYLSGFGGADPASSVPGVAADWYAYMAPERFDGAALTSRADVYSLTCVLAEILTGAQPFPGSTVSQVVKGHLAAAPPRPSLVRPHVIPPGLDAVVARGMAKNPQDRYATAGDLARAARAALPSVDQATGGVAVPISHWSPAATSGWPAPPQAVPYGAPRRQGPTAPRRSRRALVPVLIALVMIVFLGIGGVVVWRVGAPGRDKHAQAGTTNERPRPSGPVHYRQKVLLTDLTNPGALAVGDDGAVYVIDGAGYGNRVSRIPPGASASTALPFPGLTKPGGIAVDAAGNVYVTDFGVNKVWKLAPGSGVPTELPFVLKGPTGVAVAADGTIYVADHQDTRVWKLVAGSSTPTALPFTGWNWLNGVTVDGDGAVYAVDQLNFTVWKLPAGSRRASPLPFDLRGGYLDGVALDSDANICVPDGKSNQVWKLAAGSSTPTALPFSGLSGARHVAVDANGDVFVTDPGHNHVVELVAS